MCKFQQIVRPLMIVIALSLSGCASSSTPVVQTEIVKATPPASLLEDIPPPAVPETIETRDEFRDVTTDLAGWGTKLRVRLGLIREWSETLPPPR